jgi:glycosyltransferase involved in cell wall biosynthesis
MADMKVSALIPTYNRRAFIFRAVDSVLAQTLPVDEVLVVDDGSTDGTADALEARYGTIIRVIRQENRGVSSARRRAVQEATGDWVAFLDSDDEWLPERNAALSSAAAALPPDVAWVFGDTGFVTDRGEEPTLYTGRGLKLEHVPQLFRNPLSELDWDPSRARVSVLPSSLIRKSTLLEVACFSEGFRHAEDFLVSIQLATRYSFAAVAPVVTRVYRTSDLNESSLERTLPLYGDRYEAIVLGYAAAAMATGERRWAILHAQAVRALCKWRAQAGLPVRRLAREQFKFGYSARSMVFFAAAMLGTPLLQAGFAAKRKLKSLYAH